MASNHLRIATRASPLALRQAELARAALLKIQPDLHTELIPITSSADRTLDRSLQKLGGKGLFTKELEIALLEGTAEIAVHSMKDLPASPTDELTIGACLEREDPRDALVAGSYRRLAELPQGALLGTSSLRRQAQLAAIRPDLCFSALRGNLDTRLAKLDAGDCDAIVLACAGLVRLGLADRIAARLDIDDCLPAAGQGVIGIQCRRGAGELLPLLAAAGDPGTTLCVAAERALVETLGADCHTPVGALARLIGGDLELRAVVMATDGGQILRGAVSTPAESPEEAAALGHRVAKDLLDRGAGALLDVVGRG